MEETRPACTGNVEWTYKLCAFVRILQVYKAERDKIQDIENLEEWEGNSTLVTPQLSDGSLGSPHCFISHLAKAWQIKIG
jgi:hypothetical protein